MLETTAKSITEAAESDIARTLMLVSVGWESHANRIRMISPWRVLIKPWSRFRLERARWKLAHGMKPPPIRVVGFSLKNEMFYEPSDGIHRTAAARDANMPRIRARVDGTYRCDPSQFVIFRGSLWRKRDRTLEWTFEIDDEIRGLLRHLGVDDRA